jgi:pyruvate dehydrogenase E2 component (dihydrolipoamide acetyltransferase)
MPTTAVQDIAMPRLSDSMEEGTVLNWLKKVGDEVVVGEELVEIETDKANMTYESDLEGVLRTIAAEGDTLPVGAPIAQIGADDQTGAQDTQPGERLRASPIARRIAKENDIDLSTVTGTGPSGRIVKADVEGAGAGASSTTDATPSADSGTPSPPAGTDPAAVPGPADVSTAKGETTMVELSRTQQTIARRMAESKATIPHFALQSDVDMGACVALRSELKRLAQDGVPTHPAPTYNDMVVKASALALRELPRANSSYRDGRLQLHSRVNIGVAVAAEETLVVPTVFDADQKSLGEIARETRALAERVRDGSITPPELGGGTFTVSNLGMFGVASFTAIINPPQAAILSVGSLQPRAVVRDGEIVARNTMTVTLACDHRILYGADAARFLARIRELLETPAALTL